MPRLEASGGERGGREEGGGSKENFAGGGKIIDVVDHIVHSGVID